MDSAFLLVIPGEMYKYEKRVAHWINFALPLWTFVQLFCNTQNLCKNLHSFTFHVTPPVVIWIMLSSQRATASQICTAILWVHSISMVIFGVSNFRSDSIIAVIQLGSVPILLQCFFESQLKIAIAIAVADCERTFSKRLIGLTHLRSPDASGLTLKTALSYLRKWHGA